MEDKISRGGPKKPWEDTCGDVGRLWTLRIVERMAGDQEIQRSMFHRGSNIKQSISSTKEEADVVTQNLHRII